MIHVGKLSYSLMPVKTAAVAAAVTAAVAPMSGAGFEPATI